MMLMLVLMMILFGLGFGHCLDCDDDVGSIDRNCCIGLYIDLDFGVGVGVFDIDPNIDIGLANDGNVSDIGAYCNLIVLLMSSLILILI